MMADDLDAILLPVSRLTVLTPDAGRAALVRERCRARLRQRAPKSRGTLGLALFGSLCALYLAGIALDILRLQGVV